MYDLHNGHGSINRSTMQASEACTWSGPYDLTNNLLCSVWYKRSRC